MKGSNGLAPRDVIERNTKCPEAPGKRKFHTLVEAEKAAAFSSQQYHKTIVPYACSGCGMWHVTGKVRGSDVASSTPTGVIRTAAMVQRENLKASLSRVPERKDMSEVLAMETPIIPANREARLKMTREFLVGRETVTVPEIMELVQGSRHVASSVLNELGWSGVRGRPDWLPPGTNQPPAKAKTKTSKPAPRKNLHATRLRKLKAWLADKEAVSTNEAQEFLGSGKDQAKALMRDAGWVAGWGVGAKWTPGETAAPVAATPVPTPTRLHAVEPYVEPAAPAETVSVPATEPGWRTLESTDKLVGMTLAQMNQTLEAFGLEVRLQIREVR